MRFPQRFAEHDDDRAGDEVEDQRDEVLNAGADGPPRVDEQVVAGEVADDGDEEGGAVAAEPDRERHRPVERG